jgi:sugar phosphate permease
VKPPEGGFIVLGKSLMDSQSVLRKNFWIHLTEGTVYLSSGVLLSPQTVFPALVVKLGGGSIAVGAIPIIVYLVYFLPQILSANYIRSSPYRRPWALKLGILQRIQILFFAIAIMIFGVRSPAIALTAFFVIYIANQVFAGLGSPVWFDLVAKTTTPGDRGKLMGIRISLGALLGIVNGFLLTMILAFLPYPCNFAAVFGVAFLLQFTSWMILRNVVETQPSVIEPHVSLEQLVVRVKDILHKDLVYRRFLFSAAFLIVGLMPAGFFMVAAMKYLALEESYVGFFTITIFIAQIVSGASLGWLADRKGHKFSLLLCSIATALATLVALVSGSVVYYFIVFFFVGVNLGAEAITRYNFVERCASANDRPLYVGIMNAWLAPFYFSATIGGWLIEQSGYTVVFVLGLMATLTGICLLYRLPDPSRPRTLTSN